jgi:hypothetical protein
MAAVSGIFMLRKTVKSVRRSLCEDRAHAAMPATESGPIAGSERVV